MKIDRKLLLVLHGKSAQRDDVRDAIAALRAEGAKIDVRVTFEAGDGGKLATEAVRRAREGAFDVLVAGGGDGTLNEVVAAALAEDAEPACSFALLPLGTANDFARSIELPADDLAKALKIAAQSEPSAIDVGEVGGRLFVNLMTGGAGSRITAETDPTLKKLLGGAAYMFSGAGRIAELEPCRGSFSGDDFSWQGDFIAMAIGNARMAGGGIELCPDARIDDGLLDLAIIPALQREDLVETLKAVMLNGPGELQQRVIRAKSRRFQIDCREPLFVNLDGEPMSARNFDVAVRPGALRFHLPS